MDNTKERAPVRIREKLYVLYKYRIAHRTLQIKPLPFDVVSVWMSHLSSNLEYYISLHDCMYGVFKKNKEWFTLYGYYICFEGPFQ